MSDLTTTHLKHLLDQSTPGPWEFHEDSPGNLPLAALAPELAQEVIRIRGNIEELVTVMEVKATAGVSQSPATIADCLREVLGETNE